MAEQQDSLAGVRVLVVEDEYLIADDLMRALRKAGAEPVGPAGTVAEARRLILEERPGAAILDLNLRGEMASGLVELLTGSNVPFLIVSGYGEQSFPTELSHFPSLEKPIAYDRVTEKLAQVLEAGGKTPE